MSAQHTAPIIQGRPSNRRGLVFKRATKNQPRKREKEIQLSRSELVEALQAAVFTGLQLRSNEVDVALYWLRRDKSMQDEALRELSETDQRAFPSDAGLGGTGR
jgi:hypothetical protein